MGTGERVERTVAEKQEVEVMSEKMGEQVKRDEGLAEVRGMVRDVIAEELERFWERRFGGRP